MIPQDLADGELLGTWQLISIVLKLKNQEVELSTKIPTTYFGNMLYERQ
jgi:hypothetical protein